MSDTRILVVGGGGREHALCWRIARDRPDAELFAAPGNAGIEDLATLVPIAAGDLEAIAAWCREQRPGLVVVGPDDPLAEGIVDVLTDAGMRVFGPSAAAARIESSKAWAADVCAAAGVPIPASHVFESADEADAFVRSRDRAFVVKADGLALGKGVVVAETVAESHAAIDRLARQRALGSAGDRLVLQERLTGEELSVFAICDGEDFRIIGHARDYKRREDGDRGPNTGGMGAYTPVPGIDEAVLADIARRIIGPALDELRSRGNPFVGFLYAGLMLADDGPQVIEFNCRMGDPEAQVILPLLGFDLVDAMERAVDGDLAAFEAGTPTDAAVCVVLVSDGYPGSYQTDREISGLDELGRDTLVFHAGTRREGRRVLTAGGRVLGITGIGASVVEARERAYDGAAQVRFQGARRRADIAASIS